MKLYTIVFCCIITVICAFTAFGLGRQYGEIIEKSTDECIKSAQYSHALKASELESRLIFIRAKYNTLPSTSEIVAYAVDCTLYDKDGNLLCGNTKLPALPQDGDVHLQSEGNTVTAASRLSNNMYIVTEYYSGIEDLRARLSRQLILFCALTVCCCIPVFAAGLVAVYLSRRRLKRGMRAAAEGDYSVRISGCELAGDFNAMAQAVSDNVVQVNKAAAAQHDFVANFSHELKTPLTAIIGYADLLRSAELDGEDAFIAASYIFSEGKRLESLSLKLMDMIVLDKQEFPMRPLPAGKLLQHIAITVRPMLSTAELSLEFHAAASRIEGDRDLLTTLIMNLLDNARKASENGGKIILRGTVEGDRYRVSIQDFGRGIPPEELGRITEAFYMVDKSRARAKHGAGLGLALAQRIALLHGSSLEFKSQPGQGTEVSFTLKRIPKPKEAAENEKKDRA